MNVRTLLKNIAQSNQFMVSNKLFFVAQSLQRHTRRQRRWFGHFPIGTNDVGQIDEINHHASQKIQHHVYERYCLWLDITAPSTGRSKIQGMIQVCEQRRDDRKQQKHKENGERDQEKSACNPSLLHELPRPRINKRGQHYGRTIACCRSSHGLMIQPRTLRIGHTKPARHSISRTFNFGEHRR